MSRSVVTILGVTDGPRAVNDTAAAAEDGGPIVINVLANDFDDVAPHENLTIAAIDGAGRWGSITLILIYGVGVGSIDPGFPRLLGNATIAPDGRSILYTPLQSLNSGKVGTDVFKYTLAGGSGPQATGTVTVTVTVANDAPTAVNDSAETASSGGPLTIPVLANDTDPNTRIEPVIYVSPPLRPPA